jgi:hypothetical protein
MLLFSMRLPVMTSMIFWEAFLEKEKDNQLAWTTLHGQILF